MDRLRPVRRILRGVEAAQVRWFGRSVLSTLFRTPVLALETVGRRTGRSRETALAYHRLSDGDLVVVGGAGGQRQVPDWVANVRANPDVHVTVDRQRRRMTAVELSGDHRGAVWDEARAVWPQIETYERRAGRPVPVFRLQPSSRNGSPVRWLRRRPTGGSAMSGRSALLVPPDRRARPGWQTPPPWLRRTGTEASQTSRQPGPLLAISP